MIKPTAKNMTGFYDLTEQTISAYKNATDGKRHLYEAMVQYFVDYQRDSYSFKVLDGEIVVYSEKSENGTERKAHWIKEDGQYILLNKSASLRDKIDEITKKLILLDPIKN